MLETFKARVEIIVTTNAKLPTDIGSTWSAVASAITPCQEAAQQELIRRYFKDLVEEKLAGTDSYGSDHIGPKRLIHPLTLEECHAQSVHWTVKP